MYLCWLRVLKFQNKKLAEDSGEGYVSAEEEEEDFDSGNITLNGDQNIKNLSPKKSFKKLPIDGKVRNQIMFVLVFVVFR